MTDKKDGDGSGEDGEHTLIPFGEFLRRAEERDAAQQHDPPPKPKTAEEMIVDLCKLLGLISNAHDALFQLYEAQSNFMLEHTNPAFFAEYLNKTEALQKHYEKTIELLKNPQF